MTVLLGHAVSNEFGTAHGGAMGDQTGKEITTRPWYSSGNGWEYLLICRDPAMRENAAQYMEAIQANEAYGYSQDSGQRWNGYKAILANNGVVDGASGDFDCATLCLACYLLSGLAHAASGYTGSMYSSLMATGMFIAYSDAAHLTSDAYAVRGALYLRKGHVAMALSNGRLASVDADEPDDALDDAPSGEDVETEAPYVLVLRKSVSVRVGASKQSALLGIAHQGDHLAFCEKDPSTGWYRVMWNGAPAYISNRADLTRLVGADT